MKHRLVIVVLLLAAAASASAHTHLERTAPANQSSVAPPTAIELHFSEATRLTSLSLRQPGATARSLVPLPAKAARIVVVPVSGLAAGPHTVSWRAVGEDGHVMSGTFEFTVDPAAPAKPAPARNEGSR